MKNPLERKELLIFVILFTTILRARNDLLVLSLRVKRSNLLKRGIGQKIAAVISFPRNDSILVEVIALKPLIIFKTLIPFLKSFTAIVIKLLIRFKEIFEMNFSRFVILTEVI